MINYIKIAMSSDDGTERVIEIEEATKLINLKGQFWPREIKFINEITQMMFDFNKSEMIYKPK